MSTRVRRSDRVVADVKDAALGHASRNKRLVKVEARLAERPGASLPQAMVTPAELEGAYQLLGTAAVRADAIVDAHAECTLKRCERAGEALFIHDTTTMSFGGLSRREGLGRLNDGGHGFFAHVCLAATLGSVPLGVVGWRTISRTGPKRKRREGRHDKRPDRESLRWPELALEAQKKASGRLSPIHVMDAEADDYDLFALIVGAGGRFVIRMSQNRNIADDDADKLHKALESAPVKLRREVWLSERRPKETTSRTKRNRPRAARTAQLVISGRSVELRRPSASPHELPETLHLNVVHVHETNVPAGCEPVDWVLLTTEPARTARHFAQVIDIYRARWLVEEYFKALKTGCSFEKAQLESFEALRRLLAMLLPCAWQLLLMRALLVDRPDAPASTVLTQVEMSVLRALSHKPLGRAPTVQTVLLAIAQLGGHIPANGQPGWIVLWRGMAQIIEGAKLMIRLKSARNRDQS